MSNMDPYIMEILGIQENELCRDVYEKTPIPQAIRQAVYCRDLHQCQYCGARNKPLCVDHAHPERHGGKMEAANLLTYCRPCNLSKGAKTGAALSKWKASRKAIWGDVQ